MSEAPVAVEGGKKRKRTGKQREEAKRAAIEVREFRRHINIRPPRKLKPKLPLRQRLRQMTLWNQQRRRSQRPPRRLKPPLLLKSTLMALPSAS